MRLVARIVKRFALFGFVRPVPQMNQDAAGKNVAKFLTLMWAVRIGGAAGTECQADWFHRVLLGVRDDPLNLIFQFRIFLDKIVVFFS